MGRLNGGLSNHGDKESTPGSRRFSRIEKVRAAQDAGEFGANRGTVLAAPAVCTLFSHALEVRTYGFGLPEALRHGLLRVSISNQGGRRATHIATTRKCSGRVENALTWEAP